MTNEQQKPRELHLVTMLIGDELGPFATIFKTREEAESAADLIGRSNDPVVISLVERSTHLQVMQERDELKFKLLDRSELYKVAMDKGVDVLSDRLKQKDAELLAAREEIKRLREALKLTDDFYEIYKWREEVGKILGSGFYEYFEALQSSGEGKDE